MIVGHHASALMAGDVDEVRTDHADDAVLLTPAVDTSVVAGDRIRVRTVHCTRETTG